MRYGTYNVPITSVGMIVYGAIMLFAPDSSYVSSAFVEGPFQLAPKNVWAVGMIAAGILALAWLHVFGVLPLLLIVACWTFSIIYAGFVVAGIPPTAGVGWAIITTQLLVGVYRRGVRSIHPPNKPHLLHHRPPADDL